MFSPSDDTAEAVSTSGFTAINSRKVTPPGGYNTLPPENTSNVPPKNIFTESPPHFLSEKLDLGFDQELDSGISEASTTMHDQSSDTGGFVAKSIEVEYETESITLKPTSELDDQESMGSDGDVYPEYSYQNVKGEAREMFNGEQPDFCVTNSKNDMTRKEYPNPNDGHKYIVKHEKGSYWAWHGFDERYKDDEPMASTISKAAMRSRKMSGSNFGGSGTQSRSGSAKTDWDDGSPLRSLRKRTMRQEHPFRTDKVEHDLAKKGLKASESDLEEKVQDGMRPKTKKDVEAARKKKQRKNDSDVLPTSSESIVADVVARTWLDKAPGGHIPVKLNMSSVSELFDKLEESWHSVLEDQRITHCVAKFSWLDEDANIFLLRVNDGTAFGELLREAKHGLVADDRKRTVNIHISV